MIEAVSALGGKMALGPVTVADAGPRGMIVMRGDLSDAVFQSACTSVTGLDFPGQAEANCADETGLLWMAPDEVLILLPRSDVTRAMGQIADTMGTAHHLAADISDARAVMTLEGAGLREVLARLTPADMHPEALPTGQLRRTRLGQVAAAFWLRDAGFAEVICFRSVAEYVFGLLANAASSPQIGHLPDA